MLVWLGLVWTLARARRGAGCTCGWAIQPRLMNESGSSIDDPGTWVQLTTLRAVSKVLGTFSDRYWTPQNGLPQRIDHGQTDQLPACTGHHPFRVSAFCF
jgi:hypothetical protein